MKIVKLADLGVGAFYLILGILAGSQFRRGLIYPVGALLLIAVGMYFVSKGLDTK